jgi:hypothetical protein
MTMEIKKCLLTQNDCYKSGRTITPVGIVVHSTGADNQRLSRYIQPDDGTIGTNKYDNDWNRSGISKCVHAFIGTDKYGMVRCYQTLPWTMRCWGCGSGTKGTYNNGYIQFEICEDDLSDEMYFNEAFELAVGLCQYLMQQYPDIKVENIVSHNEAHDRGYASNHGDCDYWLAKFGHDMDWFRSQVASAELTKVTFKAHRLGGKWGNGKTGAVIDAVAAKLSSGKITYVSHRVGGKWGDKITGYSTTDSSKYAGSFGKAIDAVAIKATGITGTLKYRVHRKKDNKWGNWITGYSTTDTDKYAGSLGKEIDGIEIKIV